MEGGRTMGAADTARSALAGAPARLGLPLALAALLAGCAGPALLVRGGDPLSSEEHARLGAAYDAQGLRADAKKEYRAAARRDAGCAECWLALGNSEFNDGRLKEAEAAYRKALKAAPSHAGAANNLAMTLLEGGARLAEAEKLARRALPDAGELRPYVLDTLANILLRTGRREEAAALIGLALAEAPPGESLVRARLLETAEKAAADLEVPTAAGPKPVPTPAAQ